MHERALALFCRAYRTKERIKLDSEERTNTKRPSALVVSSWTTRPKYHPSLPSRKATSISPCFRCILTRLWTCMSRRLGRCCCHGWRSQSTCASPELKGPTRRGRNRTRGWCMMPWRRCYLPSLSQGAHQHPHAMLLRRLCEFAFPSRHISVTS